MPGELVAALLMAAPAHLLEAILTAITAMATTTALRMVALMGAMVVVTAAALVVTKGRTLLNNVTCCMKTYAFPNQGSSRDDEFCRIAEDRAVGNGGVPHQQSASHPGYCVPGGGSAGILCHGQRPEG
jgi:hypothetical protein